jgi:hypothetical protein
MYTNPTGGKHQLNLLLITPDAARIFGIGVNLGPGSIAHRFLPIRSRSIRLEHPMEEPGQTAQEVDFGEWQVSVAFGFPQPDGRRAPGTKGAHAAAMIAHLVQMNSLSPEWTPASDSICRGKLPGMRSEIITANRDRMRTASRKCRSCGMAMRQIAAFVSTTSLKWCAYGWDAFSVTRHVAVRAS